MVDDSMEIASEHGHNVIEEDIDIDIDITSGHADEDDILDDVDANTGFDTNFDDIPPQAGTDDLMIDDDDNASYHMEDADLLQEEADDHNMEQEPTGMYLTTDDASNEMQPTESTDVNANNAELSWENPETVEETYNAPDENDFNSQPTAQTFEETYDAADASNEQQNAQSAEELHDIADATQDQQGSEITEEVYNVVDPTDDQQVVQAVEEEVQHALETKNYTPQQVVESSNDSTNHYDEAENEAPSVTSPPHLPTDQNSHANSPKKVEHNIVPDELPRNFNGSSELPIEPEAGRQIGTEELPAADLVSQSPDASKSPSELSEHDNGIKVEEISVTYNGRHYPLVRKSPADHPNDFFFEDSSVIEKPLVEFCAEIRAVLVEDNLPPQDKISLIIQELQLVIDETHLPNYPEDLSMAQIIRLYEKLASNDGSTGPLSLNLRLVIEPTGYDRFLLLSQGAAEGKGLLDFLSWDGESEDEPTEFGESIEHLESLFDEPNPNQETEEAGVDGSGDHNDRSSPAASVESHSDSQQPETAEPVISASAENATQEQGDIYTGLSESKTVPEDEQQQPEQTNLPEDEFEDDGDLIDYEDEDEDEVKKPETTPKSGTQENRPRDATEEESRRGSITLRNQAEASEVDNQETTNDVEEALQPEEATQDAQSDIDYDEDDANEKFEDEENTDNVGLEYSLNGEKGTEEDIYPNDFENEDDEKSPHVNDEDEEHGDDEGQEQADSHLDAENVEFDLGDVFDEEGFEETTLFQDDVPGDEDVLESFASEAAAAADTAATGPDEAAESDSATISNASITDLQTSHSVTGNKEEQEDEIDYDDEEEAPQSPTIPQEVPSPKDSPVSNSGKRPRAEANFEDSEAPRTKEAKRIRS